MFGAELGEAGGGGLEVAAGFELALGGGGAGVENGGVTLQGAEGVGDGFLGDGIEDGIVGDGTGGALGVELLEDELGEEVRLVEAVELGAEVEEARADGAEVFHAVALGVTEQSEGGVDGIGGLGGEHRGRRGVGEIDELAE